LWCAVTSLYFKKGT